ncbi:DUF2505 domain-containing protein [Nocardioides aurantiacus]|uniref:DUF2505 domain-containing protein n=1 Tax=Nocardioides aurantiacus TaxID=86796 RepID=UPI0014776AE0|nr:DUF2505 domain-containing protein [Nocardioides aurantiacus]
MQLRHEITYRASPDEVFAMLADEAFRRRSAVAQGVLTADVSIVRGGRSEEGISVRIDQLQPTRGVPDVARRFVSETVRLVQLEEWSDAAGGTVVVELPGLPVTVTGKVGLEADGELTRQHVEADVEVRVPLVGARLAGFIGGLVAAGMDTEQQVGEAWLRGERG